MADSNHEVELVANSMAGQLNSVGRAGPRSMAGLARPLEDGSSADRLKYLLARQPWRNQRFFGPIWGSHYNRAGVNRTHEQGVVTWLKVQ